MRLAVLAISLAISALLGAAQPHMPQSPLDSQWWQVRSLVPGTELVMSVKGGQPVRRYFVEASELVLTTLTVDEPILPPVARDGLRDVASAHGHGVGHWRRDDVP